MSAARDVILVAFEGPDRYSFVGGLATRMNDLAEALAARGTPVRHVFVGDPAAPHEEQRRGVTLERWSQWISAHHPRDAYDGEDGKVSDMTRSLPPHLADLVALSASRGRRAVILFEDWQTADVAIQTHLRLETRGLRGAASLFWTANNTYGFWHVDFRTLERVARIATVSRFMRAEMAREGVDAEVLPNGLAQRYLRPLAPDGPAALHDAFGDRPTFVKVARFDPDKRWLWAVDAIAHLRDRGMRPRFLMRGSRSDHAEAVAARIAQRGLSVRRLALPAEATARDLAAAVRGDAADVLFLDFFIAEDVLRALYASADGVLANSEKEPFGLVGLEVMASSGTPYVGKTGEDYAVPYGNAVVVQTDDPRELEAHMTTLRQDPALVRRMRVDGRATAERFAWPRILPAYDAAWEAAARVGR